MALIHRGTGTEKEKKEKLLRSGADEEKQCGIAEVLDSGRLSLPTGLDALLAVIASGPAFAMGEYDYLHRPEVVWCISSLHSHLTPESVSKVPPSRSGLVTVEQGKEAHQ